MDNNEILQKLNSLKLCLSAHPDNEEHSEFSDRIDDLNRLISFFTELSGVWLSIEGNAEEFTLAVERNPNTLIKFTTEEVVKFQDEWPYEIATHFLSGR